MSQIHPVCQGVFTAIVTPFLDKKIDYSSLDSLLDYQIQAGVHGVIVCGTTGESPTLLHRENNEIIAYVKKNFGKKLKIIAGTGSNSTQEAIDMTKQAAKNQCDAALLVTPYYNKPTQEGLYQHYKTIALDCDIPVLLYNVPSRTAVNLSIETISKLSRIKNIIGIKEASGNIDFTFELLETVASDFFVLSGNDSQNFPILSAGGTGIISVLSNIMPKSCLKLYNAIKNNDSKTALINS